MASIFTHAVAASTLSSFFPKELRSVKFWVLSALCSMLPDADVIGFSFGIKYEDMLGHRGLSHSIFFAACTGLFIALVFFPKAKLWSKNFLALWFCFFLATVSHGILDAMTTGGLGVAFFAPFNNTRYFLPWRFILVSPIGAGAFFSKWGLAVLRSEAVFVVLPCLLLALLVGSYRKLRK